MQKILISILMVFALLCGAASAWAGTTDLVNALGPGDFKAREQAIAALAASGDPAAVPVLDALDAGKLYMRKADKVVFIIKDDADPATLIDPATGQDAGTAPKATLEKVKVNNALRGVISSAKGGLTLFSPDVATRKAAAANILKAGDASAVDTLEKAIAAEKDPSALALMKQAFAAAVLNSSRPDADKLAAIETLKEVGDRDTAALLAQVANSAEEPVKSAAAAAAASIQSGLASWTLVQNFWYGISLGSVLLLAAIGLAITFGVMGIINMAHGELVMVGAYTAYVTQQVVTAYIPGAADYALLISVPSAFIVTGLLGMAIERTIIRFLYGRPLETLLATFGLSLVLQQAVRSLFGPTNKDVSAPSWMAGSIDITNGLSLTMNRIVIVAFTAVIFFGLMLLMKRSPIGLQMRAVTQNRPMARAMGIKAAWVDTLTFGLGSGIAGLAGVALTQIDNVSPNLGQNYIIDSFLVVVFGGVGNLWGTLAGAMALGIANKFLEPFAGAVLGKIIILICVILFIQKRPRGLFAIKGRWVES
ncbi:urea ABC transporter permease subunit UrtB [Aestuariivirga litoralis]|uniref:urea ABC transporter permease subunit UrtB n=1 Tax=Aestuariivirga litoralis TaxID=2650924 RepID=UPI0018C45B0F|nr:urea ABC transporter permease subunit UrtB [Aestuariivirga litoralis]MBG1230907.1 urea ABC transporter permease subunit UrtB [Aestuariivirga litoralis]